MQAIVADPLEKIGLRISSVDKFSPEMQNPEITEAAGAGDVPKANLKMIAALAVKKGELDREAIDRFVEEHGLPGFAPTQGHVPSGVPFIGFARDRLMAGELGRVMIIGKGSLFLGRMTNQFDGVSFLLERNPAERAEQTERVQRERVGRRENPTVILTTAGSELGVEEMIRGAELASAEGADVVLVGPAGRSGARRSAGLRAIVCKDERETHAKMVELLNSGEADAAVTMHYSFPVGVATVGRVITPARGRPMFIATTTGTASTDRVQAMVKNAIYGIATAKALGITRPTVGILNLDGARQVECRLKQMAARGYRINFGTSVRADGGCIMRGNDLITGPVDVMITDSLTGNVVMKVLSAFTSGGDYETTGSGYGPGAGPGFDKIICIISRASGAPVVANALKYATQATLGNLVGVVGQEIESAIRAGFDAFGAGEAICPEVEELKAGVAREVALQAKQDREDVGSGTRRPPAKVVTEEIPGIDILELEDAADLLADKGIFAATGMGCTGPVILVAPEDIEQAITALKEGGYLQ